MELHGAQLRTRHLPLATVKFIGGLQTQRSPFASIDSRYNSRFLGGKPDALIAGSNCEISNALTLQRRFGLSAYGPSIPAPIAFFDWKKTSPPNIQTIVDTATAVYNYSPIATGLLFFKSPGAKQTNFWGVVNTLYCGNGVDLFKVVGPNLLLQSNTFSNPVWTKSSGFSVTGGQFDPNGGLNATKVSWNGTGPTIDLSQAVIPNYTPVASNTFTFSIWIRLSSGSETIQIQISNQNGNPQSIQNLTLTTGWVRYQITATMGAGDTGIQVAIGNPNVTTPIFVYNAQLEVGGPATPDQITTDQPQGVYNWGGVGPVTAPTISSQALSLYWQAGHAYNVGDRITDANGNLQIVTTNGTSGSSAPTWALTSGATTTDNTAVWTNSGPNGLTPGTDYQWYYAFLDEFTGQPTNVSPISPSTTSLANNLGVSYTIKGTGTTDPQFNKIALYRNTDGGPFFFQVGIIPNPTGGGPWSFTDSLPDAQLSSIYAPVGLLNSPPPAGAVNPTWHESRMWVSVGSVLYYSTGPDNAALLNINQNGVSAESFNPNNNIPLDSVIIRSFSTSAGLLVETASDVWLVIGSDLSSFDPKRVLKGHGVLNFNASDMDGGTILMYTSDRQVLSASSSAGTLEIGFPIGDLVAANIDPAKAYLTRHVAGSLDNAIFLGDGSTGWFRCNPNQVGASVSGEQTVVWSPFATITNGAQALSSIETSPGVHQLLVGSPNMSGPLLTLGNIAGTGASASGSGTAWTNPNNVTLSNPATPATVELNIQATTSGADISGGAIGTGTSVSTGSLGPTTVNNELALVALAGNNVQAGTGTSTTVTAGAGWTLDTSGDVIDLVYPGGNHRHFCFGFEHQSLSATGSQTGTATLSQANSWAVSLLTLKAGSGAAPTIVQQATATQFVLGGFTSTISKALASAVTSGNFLVVAVTGDAVGGATGSLQVSDTLGSVFTEITSQGTTDANTAFFLAPLNFTGAGNDTVTVTMPGSTQCFAFAINIYEVTLPTTAGALSSNQLQATNFNLSVPTGANIVGLKVFVTGNQTSENPDAEVTLSWISPSGSAPSYTFQLPSATGTLSFGGVGSTWGQALTPALLNALGFGFQLQATSPVTPNVTFNVTAVQVQVFYLAETPTSSPILFRDLTTFADNGSNFTWSATLGSLLLANPGTLAETESITVETRAANGAAPAVAVLLDEIAGAFENLPASVNDPVNFTASASVLSKRYYLSQGAEPPICTHMQLQLNGGATNTRDEILRITIRGELVPEQELS